MGFLVVLIPVACCVAIPAVLAFAAYVSSSKRKKVQDSPEGLEGAQSSLLGKEGRE